MLYNILTKQINAKKEALKNGSITQEEYDSYAEETQNKLDVFLTGNRINQTQYETLTSLLHS